MPTITNSIPDTLTNDKVSKSHKRAIQPRGEVTYQPLCTICYTEHDLLTIRRLSGDIRLCRKHARALLGVS